MDAHRWTAQSLAVARRWGLLGMVAVCVPLLSMLTMTATVAACLYLWRLGPRYKTGLLFPAISELGIDLPQKRLYQAGFALCGGLLALGILLFEELVAFALVPMERGSTVLIDGLWSMPQFNGKVGVCEEPSDATQSRWNVRLQSGEVKALKSENLRVRQGSAASPDRVLLLQMVRWGYLSAAGVVSQGIFTLERGFSGQCLVHWGGAMLFILGAMQHAKASNELYDRAAQRRVALLQDKLVVIAFWLRHLILDYSSVVLFLVPLLMQALPSSQRGSATEREVSGAKTVHGSEEDLDPNVMNTMGVMQWGIILQFAVYFCTYTADLRAAAAREVALHATSSDT